MMLLNPVGPNDIIYFGVPGCFDTYVVFVLIMFNPHFFCYSINICIVHVIHASSAFLRRIFLYLSCFALFYIL